MQTFRKYIFILILVLAVNGVFSFAITEPSYLRVALHEVQQDINYELIMLGQSHGEKAFAPYILKEQTGMETYNLSRRLMTVQDIYYMLTESNYHNTPKVVVYDIDQTYWMDNENPNFYSDSYVFPHISNPYYKLDYFVRNNLKHPFIFTFSRYHLCGMDDVRKIASNVRRKCTKEYFQYSMEDVQPGSHTSEYRGNGFSYEKERNGKEFAPTVWSDKGIKKKCEESLKKMASYCRENDIQFICVISPTPQKRYEAENHDEMQSYFERMAIENDFLFYDFNDVKPEYLTWSDEDFIDGDGHAMGEFAEKYSKVLGEVIHDSIEQKDVNKYFIRKQIN